MEKIRQKETRLKPCTLPRSSINCSLTLVPAPLPAWVTSAEIQPSSLSGNQTRALRAYVSRIASELMVVVFSSSLPWPRKRGTRPKLRKRPRWIDRCGSSTPGVGRFSTTTGVTTMATSGNDAKFFTRGKIQEFKAELQEADRGKDKKFVKRKTVLKKIVANITMGNDSTYTHL